ncbi:MAG: hypothetical protein GY851_17990 [bacterium]|nr:hypothetical protein [bacterium]
MNEPLTEPLRERHDWFDQARGLVVLLLIVSMITSAEEGNVLTGDPVLGPTFLSHGDGYFPGSPPIITLIDVGQQIFMFIMGLAACWAFTSRLRKRGPLSAWLYALRRFLLLYACGIVDGVVLPLTSGKSIAWGVLLYQGTFAKLALGALAAYTAVYFIRNADRRIALPVIIMAVHAVLYAMPWYDHHGWEDNVLELRSFPFGAVNLAAVAIAGTCFADWMRRDPTDPLVGLRQKVVPWTAAAFVACYAIDWVQPAIHHDTTTSLALLAIALSGIMILGFYAAGRAGLRLPLLSSLGKNLLLMFALSAVIAETYLTLFPKEFLVRAPYVAALLVGVAPIAVLGAIATFLDRRNILLKV